MASPPRAVADARPTWPPSLPGARTRRAGQPIAGVVAAAATAIEQHLASAPRPPRRSSATTTCSRCSRSMPTFKTATWGRYRATCGAWSTPSRPISPRGSTFADPRAGPEHEQLVPRAGVRPALRRAAGLLPDGRELPVVARSVHHPDGAARGPGGHRVDALPHAHDGQRARADGVDHVHRRGHVQQHPDGHIRQRPAGRGARRQERGPRRRGRSGCGR